METGGVEEVRKGAQTVCVGEREREGKKEGERGPKEMQIRKRDAREQEFTYCYFIFHVF